MIIFSFLVALILQVSLVQPHWIDPLFETGQQLLKKKKIMKDLVHKLSHGRPTEF